MFEDQLGYLANSRYKSDEEIVEELEAALEQFRLIAEDLGSEVLLEE